VQDPYELLGVSRNASDAEIRAAFRRMAALHHPDKNPNDHAAQQRFADLNRAYQILGDDQKRAAWDRFGEAAFRPGGFDGTGTPFTNIADLEDALKSMLGSFGLRRGPKNAANVKVELTFEEAIRGCQKSVSYDNKQLCARCGGTGGEPGARTTQCGVCEGRGKVRPLVSLFPLQRDRECTACHGTGLRAVRPCTTCRGDGVIGVRRTLDVNFPAGVDTGYKRTLKGEGNRPSPGTPAGPLIVEVTVAEHEFFFRDGDNVLCRVPITFAQAALGGEIDVRTIDGRATLRVPQGIQPNTVLRMRGKGAPRPYRGGRGDQLVEVTVEVPSELSDRARQLLLELSEELAQQKPNLQRTWKDRIWDRLR
jgi:molecular chaperone DnaJ